MILLVCLVLLLLLIGLLIRTAKAARTVARFPDFSVRISKVGREDAYVTYRERNRELEFYATVDWQIGEGKQIRIQMPKQLTDEDIRSLLPNLVLGLKKLGYRYWIYKEGETQIVAKE